MQKLYIVVRSDLDPGLMLAQVGHAVSAFAVDHPDVHRAWHLQKKNIVVVAARDLASLEGLVAQARARGVRASEFREEDLEGELTALALGEEARPLVSSLPLALRPAKAA